MGKSYSRSYVDAQKNENDMTEFQSQLSDLSKRARETPGMYYMYIDVYGNPPFFKT